MRSVALSFMLVSFGSTAASATVEPSYPFSATYNIKANAENITTDLEKIFILGESTSTEPAYGLTNITILAYSQTDFTTDLFSSNTDPTTFGLQGLPQGYVVFSGSGSNRLFGTGITTGVIDFSALTTMSTGSVTITGGEGVFKGATGTLSSSQIEVSGVDIGYPLKGQIVVNGSFQTVPEPKTDITPLCMGTIISAGFLLRQRRCSSVTSR